jgi:hypothetical protein
MRFKIVGNEVLVLVTNRHAPRTADSYRKDSKSSPHHQTFQAKKCPIPGQILGAFENEGDKFRRVGFLLQLQKRHLLWMR